MDWFRREALGLAVLGDQGDPGPHAWRGDSGSSSPPSIFIVPRVNGAAPKIASKQFGAPGALQSGEADDLAGAG